MQVWMAIKPLLGNMINDKKGSITILEREFNI